MSKLDSNGGGMVAMTVASIGLGIIGLAVLMWIWLAAMALVAKIALTGVLTVFASMFFLDE